MLQISVIVPAYNAEETLPLCLKALIYQSLPRHFYEIIVCDDGSTDATAVVAESHADMVLKLTNGGPGVARNEGVRVASGDIVVFTDADCVPEPDFLQQLTAPFEKNPDLAAVKGVYRSEQDELTARFVQREYEDRYLFMAANPRIDFIDTYAAAFRRDKYIEAGGYSPLFPLASVEDQELSFRLAAMGYEMRFLPTAVVAHKHANTLCSYFRKKMKIACWKVLVVKMHPNKVRSDSHTPIRIKLHLPLTLAFTASLLWMLFGGPWWLVGLLLVWSITLEWPFLKRNWFEDPIVCVATPIFVWTRSLAAVAGILQGLFLFGHVSYQPSDVAAMNAMRKWEDPDVA